jgi:hypothetical protein
VYGIFYSLAMKKGIQEGDRGKSDISENRPRPMFIADDPGLDFLNSTGTPVDKVVEWIPNGGDLLAWLVQARNSDFLRFRVSSRRRPG